MITQLTPGLARTLTKDRTALVACRRSARRRRRLMRAAWPAQIRWALK
jgi:hypothetical protein